jgi:hypothetical protein
MVVCPETKDDCAGEGQQQFTQMTDRLVNYEMERIGRKRSWPNRTNFICKYVYIS